MITVKNLENGQRVATKGNLVLTQTNLVGIKSNDCAIYHSDHVELVSSSDKRFKELFIALAQY